MEKMKSILINDSFIAHTQGRVKSVSWMPWLICSLGAFYYCYEYLLRISPSIMTQELMRLYHLTATQVGVFSAYYYHAYVPMQIIVGLLMDRYGPRRLLTLACLLCAVGTYLFASGQSLGMAEVGRFLVGFGSAFAFVGALKLATIWLPPNRFALVSGMITCLGMVGAMIGDILLRNMVDQVGWQSTIYLSALIGAFLTILIWCVVRDARPSTSIIKDTASTMDFPGLLIGLWHTVKNPQVWLTGLVGLLLYLSLTAFAELWGIPYLEQAHGFSTMQAANANSLIFLGWAIGGPMWGLFSDWMRKRCMPILFASIAAAILVSLILYMPGLSLFQLNILLFAFGLMCSAQILVFAIAREVTSVKMTGTAIALTNTFVMIGGNLFQPLVGKLLDMQWTGVMLDGARVYSSGAYQYALAILPIGIALSCLITFFIRETHAEVGQEDK